MSLTNDTETAVGPVNENDSYDKWSNSSENTDGSTD